MTFIKQNSNAYVTQINTVKVKPENQERLFELMREQAQEVMAKRPGFVSINLHRSFDGTQIVNYVQWETKELLDAAHDAPEFKKYFERYRDLQLESGPRLFEVAVVLEANQA